MKRTIAVAAMAMMVFALPAYSDVIISWDGNGPDGVASPSTDNKDAIVHTAGITGAAMSASLGSIGNDGLGTTPRLMSMSAAITTATSATDYAAFSVTPDTGYLLTVTDVSWNMGNRYLAGAPSANGSYGPTDWELRYSIAGGAEGTVAGGTVTYGGGYNMGQSVSETVGGVTNVAPGQDVEFRLYVWGGSLVSPDTYQATFFFDNVSVSGSVTPEPATMGLLAIGGVALLRRRK
jgi:PEP-CTERM motif-containing protein